MIGYSRAFLILGFLLCSFTAPAQQSALAPDPQQAYAAAIQAKNWPAAIDSAQQLVAASPTADHLRLLAEAQYDSGSLQEALGTFAGALQASAAERPATGVGDADWKALTGRIYLWQGNTYLKLRRTADAVVCYRQAAELDPHPGIALFNLCATFYNTGDMDRAVAACRQVTQADPGHADGWFILGSVLYADAHTDARGKFVISAETRQALQRYLEMAATGPHAADVKAMLDMAAPQ